MKNSILILMLSLLVFSCKKDDDCTDTVVNTTSLEAEYGCDNTKYLDIDLSETYKIVRNQEDFENILLSDNCKPIIDFVRFDLIIGKKGLSNGNASIDYKLIEFCETGNETLTVTFNSNSQSNAPNITYHALIPKLKEGQEFTVELVVN